jgi:hypothetical protein
VTLLGVRYDLWSLTLFSVPGLAGAALLLRSVRVEGS